MNERKCLDNGARIVPRRLINLNFSAMNISDYGTFRPATQSKDFDKDIKDFMEQQKAFVDMVSDAASDNRVFKLSRRNYADALKAILDEDSPILREIKDGFIEISFVVKLK